MATSAKQKENYELVLFRLDQIASQQDITNKKLDSIQRHYVTNEVFEEFKLEVKYQLRKKTFYNFINPVLASVTTAIITFLIIEYFRRN